MVATKDVKLKPNPFTAYRDPITGKWIVVLPATQQHTPVVVEAVFVQTDCSLSK